jgi:hypothetical protein
MPAAKAKATGAILANPKRFTDRTEPEVIPLGDPSPHMTANSRVAWFAFKSELPWLGESDRAIMEIACHVRGKLMAGEDLMPHFLTILRQTLSALGATPADRQRVKTPDAKPMLDPVEKFFQ